MSEPPYRSVFDICDDDDLPWEFSPDEPDDDDDGTDPCRRGCGPECEHWGGESICMLEIMQNAGNQRDYDENHVEPMTCPVCGKELVCYDVQHSELWLWPGDWYDPMVALGVYAVYDAPKGELHADGPVHHVWIGEGEGRIEKLIRLLGKGQDASE